MNSDEVAICLEKVNKSFKLPHEKHGSIKSIFVNGFRGKRTYEKQKVLQDISLEIKKGEFFGIVGRNGSGKSTLLKLLAGIYSPDSGGIEVKGKLTPFIELGVGFNPELTGRDNVFLNGSLLGFSRQEMETMYDEIVEFAELEDFMDLKLKNYSSGMQVRLAFSIAIRAKSDILVLDEVLAVGDEAFQRKCYQYFAEIRRQKQTVVLVTHDMAAIQQFCDKVALIDKGHKAEVGSPLKITQIYHELNDRDNVTVNKNKLDSSVGTKYFAAKVNFTNRENELEFNVSIKPKQNMDDPIVALEIFSDNGEQLIRWVTDEKLKEQIKLESNKNFNLNIILQNIFPVGIFSVRLLVRKRDRSKDYGILNDIVKFEIKNKTPHEADVYWKPSEKFTLKTRNE